MLTNLRRAPWLLVLILLVALGGLSACGKGGGKAAAEKATAACTKKANEEGMRFYSDDCEKCCKDNGAKGKLKYEVAASGPNPVSCTCR